MQQANITMIIDGSSYSLNPTDRDSIAQLPSGDRQQLVTLLEAIQHYEQQRRATARQAEGKANAAALLADRTIAGKEPLGAGDVDQLFAQLALEEKNRQKPGFTKQGLIKGFGITVAVIIILVLIF